MQQGIFVVILLAGNTPVLRGVNLHLHLYKKELNPLGTAKFQQAKINEVLRYKSIFYVQYPSNPVRNTNCAAFSTQRLQRQSFFPPILPYQRYWTPT